MRSIRTRVLVAASLALAGFLGVTGVALDRAFRTSAEASVREYLQTQVYGLLAAAELGPGHTLVLPPSLPEPRLSRSNSGLFAWVAGGGDTLWKSPSALGASVPAAPRPAAGEFVFERGVTDAGLPVFVLGYAVVWEAVNGATVPLRFTVAEDMELYRARVNEFRRTLWTWLLASVVLLIITQLGVLWWALRPLRVIAAEVGSVERGERQRLGMNYPDELQSLASNLDALLANELKQRQRYRDKLDDLAHSLKTPLAVLRNLADPAQHGQDGDHDPEHRLFEMRQEMNTQIDRMQDIVSYQLRGAAGGSGDFALAHALKPEIDKIVRSLAKAYRERQLDMQVEVAASCRFRGDVGDLIEVVGNLMDNACKHARERVRLRAVGGSDDALRITVEDDGPGIPAPRRREIVARRVRGDTRTEGQGIGLAVVHSIVSDYGGHMEIDQSELGGAMLTVHLPGAARR